MVPFLMARASTWAFIIATLRFPLCVAMMNMDVREYVCRLAPEIRIFTSTSIEQFVVVRVEHRQDR